jgi:hypothetical protein
VVCRPEVCGHVEIDLVHHSGASGKGGYIHTLTATEVLSGWTELRNFIDIIELSEQIEYLTEEILVAYDERNSKGEKSRRNLIPVSKRLFLRKDENYLRSW